MTKTFAIIAAALTLGGCASTYQLTLMPRDSGKLYQGTLQDAGSTEGPIAITIEGRAYAGTWVEVVSDRSYGYVTGGVGTGYGHRGWAMGGGSLSLDNPSGGEAKALLRSADGAGLRCDLRGGQGRGGGGVCWDDGGRAYDVQIRAVPTP
jgi:hypothetical protein